MNKPRGGQSEGRAAKFSLQRTKPRCVHVPQGQGHLSYISSGIPCQGEKAGSLCGWAKWILSSGCSW